VRVALRPLRLLPLLPPLAALLAGGACAPAAKMTFSEAGFKLAPDPEDADVPPPARDPAPEAIASEAPDGPPIDPILLRFTAEARSRRARVPAGRAFPEEVVQAWRGMVADLDQYLVRPLPQTPLLELVRTRVTVEAEWDFDQRRFGTPPPDLAQDLTVRERRLAVRIDTARAMGQALAQGPSRRPAPARLRWPLAQAGISSLFGARVDPFDHTRRLHRGLDLSADRGEPVAAAAAGWVVRAGPAGGHGLMVEVRHPGDVTTRYSHLSTILCSPGEAVATGQVLGRVGNTGRSTGPHLHFEVWASGQVTDPLPWLTGDRLVRAPTRAGAEGGPK
jgi:murein DD-endopeptidase MepM/ murein hydrolase activator NlpD